MHFHKSNVHVIYILELYCLVWYLILAWNLEIQMRHGHFGLPTVCKKDSRSEKGIQTRGQQMAWLHHVDLFARMKVIEHKIKGII